MSPERVSWGVDVVRLVDGWVTAAMDTLKVEVEMSALALDEDPQSHFATVDQFLREWEAHSSNIIDLTGDPSTCRRVSRT